MTSIYCDDIYNCEYSYLDEQLTDNSDSEFTYELLDTVGLISLLFLGTVVTAQFALLFKTCIKYGLSICKTTGDVKKAKPICNPNDKKLKIIRGVPGIGKRNYVYYLEEGLNRNFVICDWNDFFVKDNKYCFNGKSLSEAEADSFDTFLSAIENKTARIYVIGNFPKLWMYENYVKTAKLHNYTVNITELECNNIYELEHFNKRSIHNVPLHKSQKIFKSWEKDERAYLRCPYLEDSNILKSFREGCLIESDSDSDINDNVTDKENFIPNITTYSDNVQEREIKYIRIHDDSTDNIDSSNQSNIIYNTELEKEVLLEKPDNIGNDSISKEGTIEDKKDINIIDWGDWNYSQVIKGTPISEKEAMSKEDTKGKYDSYYNNSELYKNYLYTVIENNEDSS